MHFQTAVREGRSRPAGRMATRRLVVAAAAAFAFAVPVSAQHTGLGDPSYASSVRALQTPSAPTLFPSTEGATLGVPAPLADQVVVAPFALQGIARRQSSNVALMIVGGAGLLVGSIIGGDTGTVIMVGGGAMGLVGLFRYLR